MITRITCALALCMAANAQDMIGVTWSGSIYAVDSSNGDATLLGAGLFGQHCMARTGSGDLWTVSRTFLGSPQFFLTRLDPSSLESAVVASCNDIRAMADAGNGEVFALEFVANNYQLVRLDTATGARTFVGATGESIEGMAMHQGQLFVYSSSNGLGTLDQATGAFTDVGPFGSLANIQWLAVRPDGELIGGSDRFYTIDTTDGTVSLYAQSSSPAAFFRGMEATGMALPYGQGCSGIELTIDGPLKAGSLLTTHSTGYPSTGAAVGMAGAIIIGSSRTIYQNVALPLSLDPLLGTIGCSLYASVDASELSFTTGSSAPSLFMPVQLPMAIANQTFYIQHAAFDFTGATFWSNGVQLHVGG